VPTRRVIPFDSEVGWADLPPWPVVAVLEPGCELEQAAVPQATTARAASAARWIFGVLFMDDDARNAGAPADRDEPPLHPPDPPDPAVGGEPGTPPTRIMGVENCPSERAWLTGSESATSRNVMVPFASTLTRAAVHEPGSQ
jgi:hypothetical protein